MDIHQTAYAFKTFALVTILTARPCSAVKGTDGENTTKFNDICKLMREALAGFDTPAAYLPATATEAFNSISVAHRLAYDNPTQMEEEIKQAVPEESKRPQRLPQSVYGIAAKKAINATSAVFNKIKERAEQSLRQAKENVEAASKLLGAAVTGKEAFPASFDDGGNFLPTTSDVELFRNVPSKAKNCGGTGDGSGNGDNVGISLINDLLCLCAISQGGSQKLCANVQAAADESGITYSNPKSELKTAFTNIMAICPERKAKTTTAELLRLLETFDSLIGAKHNMAGTIGAAGQYILGYADSHAAGCTGGTSATCVNYMHQLKPKTGTGIPWKNKILNAIKKAEEEATGAIKVAQAETALEHINTTIWQTYDSAFVVPLTAGKKGEETPALLDPKKADECKQHKPKKTCEENGCQWKGTSDTKGACQAKPGTDNTAAGTGEQAGEAATTGCVAHKDKTKCENDKKDGKSNCA
uniref:Variant surface glycoprotein 1146 n=1 Tax=Trypanosoma brucei TaxID=5691 RepID=M4TAW3_9TRYP|nr:variant surface glycoprotein 1146 [Trypanosoma brucei]